MPLCPSTRTSRASAAVAATRAIRLACRDAACWHTHSAKVRVLPNPQRANYITGPAVLEFGPAETLPAMGVNLIRTRTAEGRNHYQGPETAHRAFRALTTTLSLPVFPR